MISLLNFYILVLIFTLLIVIWTTYVDNDCVVVGGEIIGTLPKRSVREIWFSSNAHKFITCHLYSNANSLLFDFFMHRFGWMVS
jgi:hypothetical protein